ncbi:hypothetical protein [Methanobacterium sp. SMA-27]|uniref:hypothetical protein n=1 Tax=Methanobacterium sp. SMA-27 TaxID=1495336 RepID=UPI00064F4C0C|nr:hypothetical protein [Methanobacterium sp. SMA-27]
MDEKGFIFTTDAILALVVMIVLTGSIVTYGLLPIYQGENHQHLEALADSALETMEQSGALREAAVEYSNGNSTGAETTLRSSLDVVIPDNVGYKLTMSDNAPVQDDNGVLSANDVATKVKVISGPQEGWMGRAYYKQDEVEFQDINSTAVTTLWNFHNYLKNFGPWSSGLNTYKYWGGSNSNPQSPKNITFNIPGPVNSAKFLLGGAAGSGQTKIYSADTIINQINHNVILNSSFLYIYTSSGQGPIYNYQKNLNVSTLNSGKNNFYVQFINATNTQNMPWFSILGNYSTTIHVPKGIANTTIPFSDIAGVGRPGPGNTGILYNLDSGTTSATPGRSITWSQLEDDFTYPTNTPFELRNMPTDINPKIPTGSAVASVQDINIPPGNRLFDAYTVVNAFGAEDGAIVQVQDSTGTITTVFASFINTSRTDGGYGFVPGIINIQPYLKVGNNKVRIITWDNVPGNDYDLVGLESCYSTITYSKFPIRWDTFPFANHQNTSSGTVTTETQTNTFRIDSDAQSALLFVGVGTATRNIQVTIRNSTGATSTLYPTTSPVPYSINLGDLDAAATQPTHIITSIVGNGSSLKPGNYSLTIKVTPSLAYESGDGASSPHPYGSTGDPSIFSGTRISVIYPKFLQNVWATGFANNPSDAASNAKANLIQTLNEAGYTNIDQNLIRNTTLYSGDVPNAVPVRLELWTQ